MKAIKINIEFSCYGKLATETYEDCTVQEAIKCLDRDFGSTVIIYAVKAEY